MALSRRYWLPRGGDEAERLDYQHDLLVKTVGYIIHPSIFKLLGSNPSIADVGTGTGVWLRDVAESYNNVSHAAKYHAFDISDEQFDPEEHYATMEFHLQNMKDPFEERLWGQFDLVHVRYVATGLQIEDYESAARNLIKLLRPGGAIQWQEARFDQMAFYLPNPEATTCVFKQTLSALLDKLGRARLAYPVENLARIFENAGLRDVNDHVTATDRLLEHRSAHSRLLVKTWRLGILAQNKKAQLGFPEEKIEELRCKMHAEIEDGAYARFDIHTVIGFKPKD